ncbi:MAG TPA: cyclic pyranopterin monophosphate synthase MoaC [Allosphingosinicella sp.]|jgi:cyclic pyranopterin phosphate synthase|nr:cyclic pyranopterin monophosphate synthase MoaC [Allosphingosinicella sp.]
MSRLSHIGEDGRARMVDVSDKAATARTATAEGRLVCRPETLAAVQSGKAPKGSVIATAELAGTMAAKRTADLIPLCHPLALTKAAVTVEPDESLPGFRVSSEVRTVAATGVEMEALTAVSVACLTLFDMLKGIDRTMEIGAVRVTSKAGGRSGGWPGE